MTIYEMLQALSYLTKTRLVVNTPSVGMASEIGKSSAHESCCLNLHRKPA